MSLVGRRGGVTRDGAVETRCLALVVGGRAGVVLRYAVCSYSRLSSGVSDLLSHASHVQCNSEQSG